jgi:hypothetical protein
VRVRLDTEFFAQFAHQCFRVTLAARDLAAWKFPPARHVFAFRPLRDENRSIRIKHGCCHHTQARLHEMCTEPEA